MKTLNDALTEDPEFRKLLAVENLVAEVSEEISRLMSEQSVNKAELARRLNKSRAWVTQLLSGKANMTVRTLAEAAHVLGAEIKCQGHLLCSSKGQREPRGRKSASLRPDESSRRTNVRQFK